MRPKMRCRTYYIHYLIEVCIPELVLNKTRRDGTGGHFPNWRDRDNTPEHSRQEISRFFKGNFWFLGTHTSTIWLSLETSNEGMLMGYLSSSYRWTSNNFRIVKGQVWCKPKFLQIHQMDQKWIKGLKRLDY